MRNLITNLQHLLLFISLLWVNIISVAAKKGDLIQLTLLNRHGHRAPNLPYWTYCPNDNTSKVDFRVDAGGLTDKGFQEEYEFGQFLQKTYGDFYGRQYDSASHYVRAVGQPRTIQSAMSVTEGAFPTEYGRAGLKKFRGQFVPIFQDLLGDEHLVSDSVCKVASHNAAQDWMRKKGNKLIKDHDIMERVYALCGTPKKIQKHGDISDVLKDITDAFVFARAVGIRTPGDNLSESEMWELRKLSNTILQGRLYGSEEEKTFMAVDFPLYVIHKFFLQIKDPGAVIGLPDFVDTWNTYEKLSLFVGHREALYAVSHFFGIEIILPGFAPFEIPTASTLLFGLYNTTHTNDTKPSYSVRVTLWAPGLGERTLRVKRHCRSPHLCTLEEFSNIHLNRNKKTGKWRQLCNYRVCSDNSNNTVKNMPYDN
eukprot:Tbor_TRINITY_DN5559_c1_g1::TRINITY_DN5559_c1_g1_i1::g.13197::m.13197